MNWNYRQQVVDSAKIRKIRNEKGCTYDEAIELLNKFRNGDN